MVKDIPILKELKLRCDSKHNGIRAGYYAKKIMDGTLAIEEYKILLFANYLFHSHIESQLQKALAPEFSKDLLLEQRIKSTFAKEDLLELGYLPSRKSFLQKDQISINSHSEAIGALYVTEGTAIGGAIIKKNLLRNQEVSTRSSITFFGCYGKNLSTLWKRYVSHLAMGRWSDREIAEATKMALSIFSFYEDMVLESESFFIAKATEC